MIIDCAHYHGGRGRDQGPASLTFGLHELAVEDAQNFSRTGRGSPSTRAR